MIDCNECREMISCLLDGELDEEEQTLVRGHISACPECRRVYEAFCAISDGMRESEPLPGGLHEKIMSGITEKPKKKSGIVWIKYFSAAACIALVIFAGAKSGIFGSGSDSAGGADFLREAETVSNGAAVYSDGADESGAAVAQEVLTAVRTVDEATAEKLTELLTPLRSDAQESEPGTEPDYCVSLPDGGELLIYIDGDSVCADFGDGACPTSASAEEIRKLLE